MSIRQLFLVLICAALLGCAEDAPKDPATDPAIESEQEAPLSAETVDYRDANIAFMETLTEDDGWVTLPTGVKYRVKTQGDGPTAQRDQFVEVDLTLTLIDGTQLFTSNQLGEKTLFPANGVMRGWADVMAVMPQGSRWELAIPASRGYEGQERPDIPPYSTLLFDVSLETVMSVAEMNARRQAKQEVFAKEQRAYIAEYAKKSGVLSTETGLLYEILDSGPADGLLPVKTSKVEVNYRGTYTDGREFDSSYKRGKPSFFHPSQVVPGFEEALLLMRPGDKWRLTLPTELGYGVAGFGSIVPPHAVLIFEVEVVEVYNGAKGIPSREWMQMQAEKEASQ